MLAIISDLHFCDGTAMGENVSPAAFRLALEDIYEQARWIADKRGEADLDLVFLGDVFDLLRTERWLQDRAGAPVPLSERPWGSPAALDGRAPSPAVIERARSILAEIVARNADALAVLRGESLRPPPGVKVRRILVAGNHDRLALHDGALRTGMRAAVDAVDEGMLGGQGIFTHRLEMPDYNLLARHGHEWDRWNFESYRDDARAADYGDDDYLPTPIGDPITTELAVRLPFEIARRLSPSPALAAEEKLEIYRRLQHIEDVRPVFAAVHWVYQEVARIHGRYGADKARVVHAALEDSMRAIVGDFRRLEFFEAWIEKHHRLLHLDPPRELAIVLDALLVATVETVAELGLAVDRLTGDTHGAACRAGALREPRVGVRGKRFIVYGHTHAAMQAAISAGAETEDAYLNSGTFRQRVFRTDDKLGYLTSEALSYLCFFREDEATAWRAGRAGALGPAYAAWTGTRND